ncbi:hypothetical protein Csa_006491 [Cucumis sativus]|uniref:Uncharacterized protein n=1 Tax=Cucumis sativus TaxID=3659 RepID=A0A0A0LIE0_CUCSA|nr:hypothetical protein Csa_006491 [Cucumis sativus]
MFSIKVDNLDPFLDATSLFTEFINDEICLKFSPSTFSMIARYQCPTFFAMLFMPHPLFVEYSVDRNHISRISLRCFRNALLEGQSYSSMSIHLREPQNTILFKFEPSILITSRGSQITFSAVPREEIIIREEVCFVKFV